METTMLTAVQHPHPWFQQMLSSSYFHFSALYFHHQNNPLVKILMLDTRVCKLKASRNHNIRSLQVFLFVVVLKLSVSGSIGT